MNDTDRRATLESRLLSVVSSHGGQIILASSKMEAMVRELADCMEEWPELAHTTPESREVERLTPDEEAAWTCAECRHGDHAECMGTVGGDRCICDHPTTPESREVES